MLEQELNIDPTLKVKVKTHIYTEGVIPKEASDLLDYSTLILNKEQVMTEQEQIQTLTNLNALKQKNILFTTDNWTADDEGFQLIIAKEDLFNWNSIISIKITDSELNEINCEFEFNSENITIFGAKTFEGSALIIYN